MPKKRPNRITKPYSGPLITKPYSGPLNVPVVQKFHSASIIGGGGTPEVDARDKAANDRESVLAQVAAAEKIPLLFDHFEIQRGDGDWSALAIYLAFRHVPGFQMTYEHGRTDAPTRDTFMLLRLVADVELAKRRRRQTGSRVSDKAAIDDLVSKSGFKDRWGKYKPGTLRNLLVDARKNPVVEAFWKTTGPLGVIARDVLIEEFSITKKQV